MIETIVRGKGKEVIIGGSRPLCIIGERINPTGNRKLREGLERGDLNVLKEEASKQVEAGADLLDVNVGVSGLDEPSMLRDAVHLIQELFDIPLCIDSANTKALEAGLSSYKGRALINSVNGEEWKLKEVLPLVKEYGAAVIGLTMDEEGIPMDANKRLLIAEKILDNAINIGLNREDIVIDPISTAIASDHTSALTTFETIRLISTELGLNTTIGASNISFGLPDRDFINVIFLGIAAYCGLTSAILDPTKLSIKKALYVSNMLLGNDEYCMEYIGFYRNTTGETL